MADDSQPEPPDVSGDLSGFKDEIDDEAGLSLDALSDAYAQLIEGGDVPYSEPATEETDADEVTQPVEEPQADCDVTPTSIVEAMLFVGHPEGSPLTSEQIAALMRGVRRQEIPEIVEELNARYAAEGSPYSIMSEGEGYVMRLTDQYARLRERFYGRVREAKLSQAAVDVLAIVAYKQPVGRDEVEEMRGAACGSMLSQLVRRQLLRIERTDDKPRKTLYFTTDRFLDVFGLSNLADLPQTHFGD